MTGYNLFHANVFACDVEMGNDIFNVSFHVLFFILYSLFFRGHMESARLIIISSSVGDLLQSWRFYVLFFIFNGSHGIRHNIIFGW